MPRKSPFPQSRRHVQVYDEDWEYLASVYNPENGSAIRGPGHAIREIIHRQVLRIRENAAQIFEAKRKKESEGE